MAGRGPGTPEKISDLGTDIAGFALAPLATGSHLGRSQHGLRRRQLRQRPRRGHGPGQRPRLRPDLRPPLGRVGRAGRAFAHLHLRLGRWPAARRRNVGGAEPGRRFAVQADGRRRGNRLGRRRPHALFRAARGRAPRAQFDQSRHFRRSRRRQRRAGEPHRRQSRHRHHAGRFTRRALAGIYRHGARDLRGGPPGDPAPQPRHRRNPRPHPGLGPLGRIDRLGAGRWQLAGHRARHARRSRLPRRHRQRAGHKADAGRGGQCRAAAMAGFSTR